ncbi:hypothetical protein Tco_1029952 [Tanacetum coccineum]|uniref:Uncharacterized protein n=1 Tax=Tanacetum coccineum TaxID=301880 RepID=A0ABQ5G4W4_9ASTR
MTHLSMMFTHMEVMRSLNQVGKARRRAKIVHSDDEDIEDGSSKQGRKLSDAEVQEKASTKTEPFIQEVTPTEVIQDQGSSEKGSAELVSTVRARKVSNGKVKRKERKDKGKAIMIDSEPKKKSKKELEQERLSFVEAIKLEEQMSKEQLNAADCKRLKEKLLDNGMKRKERTKSLSKAKPIFEKVWDFNQHIEPMDSEHGSKKMKSPEKMKSAEKIKEEDDATQKEMKEIKERYSTSRPEGYDLMLWGDVHTLFEPDEEDKLWKNQHEYNVISWSLYDFCGIHILLMQNGIAIHMLTEKKYPLSHEMISKMLKKKLEVDHESSQAFERLRIDQGVGSVQEKASTETEPFIQEVTPTEVIQDQGSSEKRSAEVSTAGAKKGTASEEVPIVSTAEVNLSTAGRTITYSRRSEEQRKRKDKEKAIMIESEPKKKSKKNLEQERLSFAKAIRLEEQISKEQRAHIARDEKIARQ